MLRRNHLKKLLQAEDALAVLDELMSALYVANPKVYNGVMRKLERLQNE